MRNSYTEEPPGNQDLGLTWRTNWISWFESPWGIIEKFNYANLSSSKDFMKLFGSSEVKMLKTTIGQRNKSLMTLAGIDDIVLSKVIGFSLKSYNMKLIEVLSKPLYDGDQHSYSYFHNDLIICPLCIKGGYHSIIHQFILVNKCPFHQINLINVTKRCESKSCKGRKHEISGNNIVNPFGCNCGLSWLDPIDFYNPKWFMPQKHEIKDDSLKDWITENDSRKFKKIFYIKRNDIPITPENLLTNILEISNEKVKQSKSENFIIKSGKNIDKMQIVRSCLEHDIKNDQFLEDFGPYDYDHHFNYIFEASKKTVNSIARMIRKKIYYKHKNCAIRMKNYLKESIEHEDPFCPIAFSYLKWRQYIQGFNNLYKVDNYGLILNNKRQKNVLDIGVELDKEWLLDLFKTVKNQIVFYSPNNIQGLTWVFNRILAQITINHFNNLLYYTVHCWKKDKLFLFTKQHYKGLESFLVKFPLDLGDSYEFHVYGKSNLIDIKLFDKYCPFQTPGKYKLKPYERKLSPIRIALEKME